jgi:beta-xylosidase
MIEAIKFWNEPNNQSHWDFHIDPDWSEFAHMTKLAAIAVRDLCPNIPRVLGGMSPIDPNFVRLLESHGLIEHLDVIAVHGFPLDWNHWQLNDWPAEDPEIEAGHKLADLGDGRGVSSFGAEEVQVFGLQRTKELLLNAGPASVLV